MRIVVLTNDWPNMGALCHKISERHELACVVSSKNIPKNKKAMTFSAFVSKVISRLTGFRVKAAWDGLMRRYQKLYPTLFPAVPVVKVDNINDPAALEAIRQYNPDLVVVSGTNLVGEKIIGACESEGRGIVNLHTGISPYIKGGPNCTNWCLATGDFHLIGNTVMRLDAGIDSGAIIATEQTKLSGNESLEELHWKVMEHGFDLYCRVIDLIEKNGMKTQAVPQDDIAEGRTYYNRDWNAVQVLKAQWNHALFFSPDTFENETFVKKSSRLRLIHPKEN